MKRRAAESKKLIKAGGVAVDSMTDEPKKKAPKANKPAKKSAPVHTEAPVREKSEDEILFIEPLTPEKPAVKPAPAVSPRPELTNSVYTEEALKIMAKQAQKAEKPKSERAIARQEKAVILNDKKAEKAAGAKLPDEKAQERLMKRRLAAEKKARKNELKIQKQYEKARKQAEKKNNKKK